jgi:hypothetical protein
MREIFFREALMLQCRQQARVLRRQRLVMARHAGGFEERMMARQRGEGFDIRRPGGSQGAPDERGGEADAAETRIDDHARDRGDSAIQKPGGSPAILLRELSGKRLKAEAAVEHGPRLDEHCHDRIFSRTAPLPISRGQHPRHRHRTRRAIVELRQRGIVPPGPLPDGDLPPQ